MGCKGSWVRIPLARYEKKRSVTDITDAERFSFIPSCGIRTHAPAGGVGRECRWHEQTLRRRDPSRRVARQGRRGRVESRLPDEIKRLSNGSSAAEPFCFEIQMRDSNTRPRSKGGSVFACFTGYAETGWAAKTWPSLREGRWHEQTQRRRDTSWRVARQGRRGRVESRLPDEIKVNWSSGA